jgi:hypothetical protein
LNSEAAIAALNLEDSQEAAAAAVKVDKARELKLKLISSAKALREKESDPDKWSSSDILLMLKYKKVSNVSQYTSKQSRLEKYQSCKDTTPNPTHLKNFSYLVPLVPFFQHCYPPPLTNFLPSTFL